MYINKKSCGHQVVVARVFLLLLAVYLVLKFVLAFFGYMYNIFSVRRYIVCQYLCMDNYLCNISNAVTISVNNMNEKKETKLIQRCIQNHLHTLMPCVTQPHLLIFMLNTRQFLFYSILTSICFKVNGDDPYRGTPFGIEYHLWKCH